MKLLIKKFQKKIKVIIFRKLVLKIFSRVFLQNIKNFLIVLKGSSKILYYRSWKQRNYEAVSTGNYTTEYLRRVELSTLFKKALVEQTYKLDS